MSVFQTSAFNIAYQRQVHPSFKRYRYPEMRESELSQNSLIPKLPTLTEKEIIQTQPVVKPLRLSSISSIGTKSAIKPLFLNSEKEVGLSKEQESDLNKFGDYIVRNTLFIDDLKKQLEGTNEKVKDLNLSVTTNNKDLSKPQSIKQIQEKLKEVTQKIRSNNENLEAMFDLLQGKFQRQEEVIANLNQTLIDVKTESNNNTSNPKFKDFQDEVSNKIKEQAQAIQEIQKDISLVLSLKEQITEISKETSILIRKFYQNSQDQRQEIQDLQSQVTSLEEKFKKISFLKSNLEPVLLAIDKMRSAIENRFADFEARISAQDSKIHMLANKNLAQQKEIDRLSKALEATLNYIKQIVQKTSVGRKTMGAIDKVLKDFQEIKKLSSQMISSIQIPNNIYNQKYQELLNYINGSRRIPELVTEYLEIKDFNLLPTEIAKRQEKIAKEIDIQSQKVQDFIVDIYHIKIMKDKNLEQTFQTQIQRLINIKQEFFKKIQ